jgi:dinuclear metal center YbgI/SA1388 family protein
MTIRDLLKHIETFAPLSLALSWDNCGLLVGSPEREVEKALISLDVTPNTVHKAIEAGAGLIISHHPLIFRPIKSVTDPLLLELLEHRIAVICLHTNLDVAAYGVNHALADALGLEVIEHLSPESGSQWFHLSLTVPRPHTREVAAAASAAGAGRIGSYDSCSTRHPVTGTFRPGEGSHPALQNPDASGLSSVEEDELEFMVDQADLGRVIGAVRKAHPYEIPLLYHYPVANPNPAYGLGLVCRYPEPLGLSDTAALVKERLGCPDLRLWIAGKDPSAKMERIAVCGGAGSSLLAAARAKADLIVTGDITYHHYLDSPIPIIDAGHFYTEYPVLDWLRRQLEGFGLSSEVLPREEHEFVSNLICLRG